MMQRVEVKVTTTRPIALIICRAYVFTPRN